MVLLADPGEQLEARRRRTGGRTPCRSGRTRPAWSPCRSGRRPAPPRRTGRSASTCCCPDPRCPPASSPAPASFSTPTARPKSASPALTAMIGDPQGGGPGGAGVGHVVDRDAGLADLLLQLLADAAVGAHQVAGGQHAHVLHASPRRPSRRRSRPRRPGRRCPCRGACRTSSCGSRGSRRRHWPWWVVLLSPSRLSPSRVGSSSRVGLSVIDRCGAQPTGANRTRWPRCRRRPFRSERRQVDLHPERHVLGVRGDVDQVAAHAGAAAVDHGGDEGHRDARGGQRDDREGPTSPSVGTSTVENSVPQQLAQAFRRSKNRAPHERALVGLRCG